MNLRADMMGNETHDPFAVGGGQSVHPDTTIRVQHHLDHNGIFQKTGYECPSAVRNIRAPRATASGLW